MNKLIEMKNNENVIKKGKYPHEANLSQMIYSAGKNEFFIIHMYFLEGDIEPKTYDIEFETFYIKNFSGTLKDCLGLSAL